MTTAATAVINHPSGCAKCAVCQCRCCINKRTKCLRVRKTLIQSAEINEHRGLLILVRHGTSQDEVDKRYSGWNDCDLSNVGKTQMQQTGQALRQANFSIDLCFTSLLKRASKSLFILQEEMNYLWTPVVNTWRLNDRMLGTLTGFHRDRAEALFGQNQIKEWLTRPELAPPILEDSSPLHPRLHYKYRSIFSLVPSTETLMDIRKRLIPFFYDQLMSNLYLGQNILVVTHEPIVKAIIRLLHNYTVDEFENLEVPTGTPIVFELAPKTHQLLHGYYLSSPLLEKNTDDRQPMFPTGFSTDNGKFSLSKDLRKQFSKPNVDLMSPNEHEKVHLEQNIVDSTEPTADISNGSRWNEDNNCNEFLFIQMFMRLQIRNY